jgi:hypothetical protein
MLSAVDCGGPGITGLVGIAGGGRRVAARGRGGEGAVLERRRCHDCQQDFQPGLLKANLGCERATALAASDVVCQQVAVRRGAAQDGELLANLAAVSREVMEWHAERIGPAASPPQQPVPILDLRTMTTSLVVR